MVSSSPTEDSPHPSFLHSGEDMGEAQSFRGSCHCSSTRLPGQSRARAGDQVLGLPALPREGTWKSEAGDGNRIGALTKLHSFF